MKRKLVVFFMSLAMASVAVPGSNCNVYAEEATTTDRISGDLLDEMLEICPDLTASEDNGVLNITIPSIDMSNGTNPAAHNFMKTVARLLNCKGLSKYSGVVIGYFKEDGLVLVNASEYKSSSDFITRLTVNFDDESFNEWATTYYDQLFGHFDSENYFATLEAAMRSATGEENVEMPEYHSVDDYILFGCTPGNLKSYSISNDTMYVHLTGLENTKEEGARIGTYVTRFYNQMAHFYGKKNVCSFDKCEFICVGENGELLRTIGFYVQNMKLEVSNNVSYSSDFTEGFNSSIG